MAEQAQNRGDLPPSGRIVAVLYKDPSTGKRHRLRAVRLRSRHWEAGEAAEEPPESFWDWGADEKPYWPEGWYEAAELPEPQLIWLPKASVLAWREFPAFSKTEEQDHE